ncbi:MAG: hypothetical protein R3A47_05380 [Polyangiales bacterium]
MRYVGPSTLELLIAFAESRDLVPTGDDVLGRYDQVTFTVNEAHRTIEWLNRVGYDIWAVAGIDVRAIASIQEALPIATVYELSEVYWVGPSTMARIKDAALDENGFGFNGNPSF